LARSYYPESKKYKAIIAVKGFYTWGKNIRMNDWNGPVFVVSLQVKPITPCSNVSSNLISIRSIKHPIYSPLPNMTTSEALRLINKHYQ